MTLEIDINRQDYSDFNKYHFVKTRLTRTIITGILTIVILEWFLNKDTFDMTATVISAIVCGLVYVFVIVRQLQNTKNIPKDDGTILGKKTFQFNDNEIICKATDSTTDLKWTTIKSIDNGKSAYYLYLDSNMAIIVPKRHFKTDIEQTKFVDLVKTKINAA